MTIRTSINTPLLSRIEAHPPQKPQRAGDGFNRELTEAQGRSQTKPQPEEQTPVEATDENESPESVEQTSEKSSDKDKTSPEGDEQEIVAEPQVKVVVPVETAAPAGEVASDDDEAAPVASSPKGGDGAQTTSDLPQRQQPLQANVAADAHAAPLRIVPIDLSPGSPSHAQPVIAAQSSPQPPAAAPGSVAAPLPDPPTVDANVARVARGLHTALQQNGGTITLRLNPPEMGLVRVEVKVDGANVSAQLQTETEAVRSLLHGQMRHLRHALESQGLNVERLNVQTQPPASPGEQQQLGDEANDGRSRGRHDGGGRQTPDDQDNPGPQRGSFEQTLLNLVG